jgi:hypothetical protein
MTIDPLFFPVLGVVLAGIVLVRLLAARKAAAGDRDRFDGLETGSLDGLLPDGSGGSDGSSDGGGGDGGGGSD